MSNVLTAGSRLLHLAYDGDASAFNDIKKLFSCENDDDRSIEIAAEFSEELTNAPNSDYWTGKEPVRDFLLNCEYTLYYIGKGAMKYKNPSCMFGLSYSLFVGLWQPADEEKAYAYLEAAVDGESPSAMAFFGSLIYEGVNYEKNAELGIDYMERAVEAGNNAPLNILANYYQNIQPDYEKAAYYTHKLLELNNPNAYYLLGTAYLYGEGVEKDLNKACEYLTKGLPFDEGNGHLKPNSYRLALLDCYTELQAEDGENNYAEKVRSIVDELVERDDKDVCFYLALFHDEGAFGYPKDPNQAVYYYTQCVNNDCAAKDFAAKRVEELSNSLKEGSKTPLPDEEADLQSAEQTPGDFDKEIKTCSSVKVKSRQSTGECDAEIRYKKKKKKILYVTSYVLLVLTIAMRFLIPLIPWAPIAEGVFKYSYATTAILFCLLRIKDGKKGFIAGLFIIAGLVVADFFFLTPAKEDFDYNYVLLPISVAASIVMFFICMNRITMQTWGWYAFCCLLSLAFVALGLLIAVVIAGLIIGFVGSGIERSASRPSSSSSGSTPSVKDQAVDIARYYNADAIYNDNGQWYITDSLGNSTAVDVCVTEDRYNTHFKSSDGKSYVVPHNTVSSDEIYF